ncbi:alanyl-tRNA synthetase [Strigomonas culicis]|uniref:Alanyl-tRNA synthetase n=1 Tax=Strigomonas culicis TaxID=28005 RepID=S9TSG4_9TRYP|nr:alanyl-tRNA synthetase [Strigomonas culicis]|eukprot:EPY19504.1 alanyl-tRNA synthetase [Strigomonas culicis]
MQHHTAQHLLSRVVEGAEGLQLKTVSWSLTHPYCFIVLDLTPILEAAAGKDDAVYAPYVPFVSVQEKKIKQEMLQRIQDACNRYVAENRAVHCVVTHAHREAYESDAQRVEEPAEVTVRSRGIPADVSGPIRHITIDGVDACTCCGTHLRQLAELHALQVLPASYQEVKNNTVKLFFVTGERLLRGAGDALAREKQLVSLLGGAQPAQFVPELQRLSKEKTAMEKVMKRWMGELAVYAAAGLRADHQKRLQDGAVAAPTVVVLPFKEDVELDYYNTIRNVLDGKHAAAGAGAKGKAAPTAPTAAAEGPAVDCSAVVLLSAWAAAGATAANKSLEGQVMVSGNGNKKDELEKIVAQIKTLLSATAASQKKQTSKEEEEDAESQANTENIIKGGISKTGFRGKGNIYNWKAVEQFDWSHFLSSA